MGDLLVGLCTYMALQVNGTDACKTATRQAYEQSGSVKSYFDDQERYLAHYGLGVYNDLPFKEELGAIGILTYDAAKKDFKFPLTGGFSFEYSDFNKAMLIFRWRF